MNQENARNEVRRAVCTFWNDFLGCTPADVQVAFTADLIIVILRGPLSPAEQKVAATPEGRMRLKQVRGALLDQGRDGLTQAIAISIHTSVVRTLAAIDVSKHEERVALVFGADKAGGPVSCQADASICAVLSPQDACLKSSL